jgi:hypothetical protein
MIYTWSNKWINAYESSWSIIEKFKAANRITTLEFNKMFLLKVKKRKSEKSNQNNYDFNILSDFDNQKIIEAFGFSLLAYEEENKKIITLKLPAENRYFRTNLAYCQDCLNQSFHSIFHQFSLLNYCPFHLISLKTKCVNCKKDIPYKFNKHKFTINNACQCLNLLPNDIHIFRIDLNIKCNKLTYFLTLKDDQVNRLKKIFFLNDNFEDKEFIFDAVLSVLENSYALPHFSYSCTSNYISKLINWEDKLDLKHLSGENNPNINELILKEKRIELFEKSIDGCIRDIIISLANHFRKRYLYNHRGCIKRILNPENNEPFCPVALAYISWRKQAENLNNYFDVDNFEQPKHKYIDYLPKYDHATKILSYCRRHFKDYEIENRAGIRWIINKSIGQELIYQFVNLLKISTEYSKQKIIPNPSDNELKQQQNYICIFTDAKNEPFEFINLENNISIISLINQLSCPYNRNKKRRFSDRRRIIYFNRRRKEYLDNNKYRFENIKLKHKTIFNN